MKLTYLTRYMIRLRIARVKRLTRSTFKLTPTEREVFEAVESGMSVSEACKHTGHELAGCHFGDKLRIYRLIQAELSQSHEPISHNRAKGRIMADHRVSESIRERST